MEEVAMKKPNTFVKQRAFREVSLVDDAINVEERTAKLTFMTEVPCNNWYVPESVICSRDAAVTTRLDNGVMPLLFNHNRDVVIGLVRSIDFEDGRAIATVQFYDDEEGEKVFQKGFERS
jgi:hypothetical protein